MMMLCITTFIGPKGHIGQNLCAVSLRHTRVVACKANEECVCIMCVLNARFYSTFYQGATQQAFIAPS